MTTADDAVRRLSTTRYTLQVLGGEYDDNWRSVTAGMYDSARCLAVQGRFAEAIDVATAAHASYWPDAIADFRIMETTVTTITLQEQAQCAQN